MATKRKTTTVQTKEITWVCGECKTEWKAKWQADSCCAAAKTEEESTCERCGRDGHVRSECYARTHERGYSLSQPAGRGACYRCGRTSHYANECYASTHIRGYDLDD